MESRAFKPLTPPVTALATVCLARTQSPAGLQDLFDQRVTTRSSINVKTAKNLQLAWKVPANDRLTAAALVQDGRVFFTDRGGDVYAVNARTGESAWKKTGLENVKKWWPWHRFGKLLHHDGPVCLSLRSVGERLSALMENFKPNFQGRVTALDAATGRTLWFKHRAQPVVGWPGGDMANDVFFVGNPTGRRRGTTR